MKKFTIIWDFDGTILPVDPHDSEQSLLIYLLNESRETLPLFKRVTVRAIIYADMKEWLRNSFKKLYLRFLKGVKVEILDHVAECLAEKIPEADRQTLLRLKEDGHKMMVLSCGTADLSERVLKQAGLDGCFEMIEGNRFQIEKDHIIGMDLRVPDPEDKVKLTIAQGISPKKTVVIGDGYTDLPLLDWAGIPVIIDRKGEKKNRYASKDYHFISSIPEILQIIERE